jgi:hypothetical protein
MKDHECCIGGGEPCPLRNPKYFTELLTSAKSTYRCAFEIIAQNRSRKIEVVDHFGEYAGDIRLSSSDVHEKIIVLRASPKQRDDFRATEVEKFIVGLYLL